MSPFMKLASAAAIGISVLAAPASAAIITQTQTQGFGFASLNGTTTVSFNGFNSSLGTLLEVVVSFSAQMSLASTAVVNPAGSGNTLAGSPNPISAIGSLTLTSSSLTFFTTLTSNLATPGFTGTVFDNQTNTLGTATGPLSSSSGSITNPLLLSQYIGGPSLVSLTMTSTGTQGGSVPSNVFTSNTGNSEGSMTVVYRYNDGVSTPEPATMAVLGAGLLALGVARRKRRA